MQFNRFLTAHVLIILFAVIVFAGPQIHVDKATFDYGTVTKGKVKKIKCKFKIKNTGNKPLVLKQVRPSCGCTVVEYDTTIMPNKFGILKPEVDITKARDGKMRKSITVKSNATNKPELKLAIEAYIQPIVGVDKNYVKMTPETKDKPIKLVLSSKKEDLQVKEIEFKSYNKANNSAFPLDLPVYISYQLLRKDIKRDDGYYEYVLTMHYVKSIDNDMHGDFVIKTNHRKMRKLKVRGMIKK